MAKAKLHFQNGEVKTIDTLTDNKPALIAYRDKSGKLLGVFESDSNAEPEADGYTYHEIDIFVYDEEKELFDV